MTALDWTVKHSLFTLHKKLIPALVKNLLDQKFSSAKLNGCTVDILTVLKQKIYNNSSD